MLHIIQQLSTLQSLVSILETGYVYFRGDFCENIQKIKPNIFKLVEQLRTVSHPIYFFFFQYCLINIKYLIFTFTSLYWKVNQTSNGMPHSIRIETASKILRRIQFKVRTHGLGSSQVTQPGSHIKHWQEQGSSYLFSTPFKIVHSLLFYFYFKSKNRHKQILITYKCNPVFTGVL